MPMFAVVGRQRHPVESYEQVSRTYLRVIAAMKLGASEAPNCRIVNEDGTTIATCSYNGRVWLGADGYVEGARPVYDPVLNS